MSNKDIFQQKNLRENQKGQSLGVAHPSPLQRRECSVTRGSRINLDQHKRLMEEGKSGAS